MSDSRTIVVAGAGIGGLTAALALAARGFKVIVLERSENLQEAGAGIQLSANATRILIDLGLEPVLADHVIAPGSIQIMTARTGTEIGRIPLGESATFRYGAPYWIVRRADLQAALVSQVTRHPDIDLRLGAAFEDVATDPKGVTIVQRSGTARQHEGALALIGADGVWSSVRHQVFPDAQPQFTGHIAWRGTVEASQLPRGFNMDRVQLWMGTNAHLVAYPISGGKRINVVAIIAGDWNRTGWSEPGDGVEIANQFSAPGWPMAARTMIGAVDSWRKWALFAMGDGGAWNRGPIALLGDASHAMLPFAAQGAGMAIEDAAVIAKCLAHAPTDPACAFAHYAALRAPRVARAQRMARRNGQIYHLGGPIGFARDLVIRMLGGSRLLSKQDWIYDWRVP